MRKRFPWFLVAFLCWTSFANAGEPQRVLAEHGETLVPLRSLPSAMAIGRFQVTVARPSDPEITSLGGSGGPILELRVSEAGRPLFRPTTIQAIWLFVRSEKDQLPEFSVWSKTGVSSYVKCRLVPKATQYCISWCQDFDAEDTTMRPTGALRQQPACG